MATHEGCKGVHDPSVAGSKNSRGTLTAHVLTVQVPKSQLPENGDSSKVRANQIRIAIAGIATTHENEDCTHAAGALHQGSVRLEPAVMARVIDQSGMLKCEPLSRPSQRAVRTSDYHVNDVEVQGENVVQYRTCTCIRRGRRSRAARMKRL